MTFGGPGARGCRLPSSAAIGIAGGEGDPGRCPCGHPSSESERHPMPRSVFDVVQCKVCGNVYLYSGRDPVRRLYIQGGGETPASSVA
jgi:hypothetical protein